MIEIKNKRMILFREDRLIGAVGDVDTSSRKFILNAVQGETDLSKMVAWIKIDPMFPNESPYDQMLKKEIVGDKIVLTWSLTAKNLQRAGEISAQIIFASPDYFIEDELEDILGALLPPSAVVGISAPVWQSYPEIFVVEESISATEGYKELEKNVLVAAVAEAAASAQEAQASAEAALSSKEASHWFFNNVENMHDDLKDDYNKAKEIKDQIEEIYEGAKSFTQTAESYARESYENVQQSEEYLEEINERVAEVAEISEQTSGYMLAAKESVDEVKNNIQTINSTIKRSTNFRLIYKKALTAEDTDCYRFDITEDTEGNPFSLSEFVIFMHFPMMPESGGSYIKVNILPDDSSVTTYQNLCQFAALSQSKDMYIRSEHKNMGRWVTKMTSSTAWNQNAGTLRINGSVASAAKKTDGKSAIAVSITQHADVGAPFPEESMIEIWGVDSVKEAE